MIWLLIAAGLVFAFCLLFVWALCAAAARADRMVERARVYSLAEAREERLVEMLESPEGIPGFVDWPPVSDVERKRPGDASTSRGMTEDR